MASAELGPKWGLSSADAIQLDNVTTADVYFGRQQTLLSERQRIKQQTMQQRKKEFLAAQAA